MLTTEGHTAEWLCDLNLGGQCVVSQMYIMFQSMKLLEIFSVDFFLLSLYQ